MPTRADWAQASEGDIIYKCEYEMGDGDKAERNIEIPHPCNSPHQHTQKYIVSTSVCFPSPSLFCFSLVFWNLNLSDIFLLLQGHTDNLPITEVELNRILCNQVDNRC